RVNLLSATMTAAASVFWYLVIFRVLRNFTEIRRARLVGAGVSVALSATAFTVWNHSNVNEKVYTVSLATIAFLSWLAFRWRDNLEAPPAEASARWRSDNVIVLMAFVLALSVGNHLMGVLVAPALGVLFLLVRPQIFLSGRLYAAVIGVVLLGLSVQMFLPIRAELNPVINEASPTCESLGSAAVSIVTFGRAGCDNLSASLQRKQYAKPPLTTRMAPFWAQMATYLQYFDWQWARSLDGREGYFGKARLPVTLLFTALGVIGAWQHWRRDRKGFAFFGTLFFTVSILLVFYMNFRYGFRQAQVLGTSPFEVRERDYFFIVSFSLWGLWAGVGLTWVWLRLAEKLYALPRPRLAAAPVLAIALIPLALNWSYASRAGDYLARDLAYNMLQSVEPYGVLFTTGDNDTFPLWYLQEVEGIRRDVTVIVASYLNTGWYAKQIRDLSSPCPEPGAAAVDPTRIICQRPFDPATAVPIYGNVTPPTTSALPLSDEQIAAITESYSVTPATMQFDARGISARIPAGTTLAPAEQFILAVLRLAWGDRPVHFSGLVTPENLGLRPYLARHGITYKLVTPEEAETLVRVPPELSEWTQTPFIDAERTRQLLWEHFSYDHSLDRPVWTDHSTRNLPLFFAFAHADLATAANIAGDSAAVERNMARAEEWVDVATNR
ncbi:MAG TPA: DUF2723 domain-containing protein, partial [Longimicrobiales bacterium]|nr:DUF2723 domain-containing protein [Longimicrobiales bacterium]